MNFFPIASGSSGNCYILSDGDSSIMIEAGIPWNRVQRALDFQTRNIEFCLVSHSHGDHAGHIKSVMRAGIDCYTTMDTGTSYGILTHHRFHGFDCNPLPEWSISGWNVKAFGGIHDVTCACFLISRGPWKALYISDSMYSPFRFGPGLTHIFLEINYSKETLDPDIDPARYRRLVRNHMSLETAKGLLAANDLSRVQEIWLLHLSQDNSDADYFKTEIERLTGKPVFVA